MIGEWKIRKLALLYGLQLEVDLRETQKGKNHNGGLYV